MREIVHIRVDEDWASANLGSLGKRLSELTRDVTIDAKDPLFEHLAAQLREANTRKNKDFPIYTAAWVQRHYRRAELGRAELFRLKITAVFEPEGESCGTVYDDSCACRHCGAGRQQISDLVLDLRKVPKTKDIARSIADEWIVSQRLAELLMQEHVTGFELRMVHHKARYQDDPKNFKNYPTGREILRRAEAEFVPHPTWPFWVWLNRPEQRKLLDRMDQEHVSKCIDREQRRPTQALPIWYQLIIPFGPLTMVEPTRCGIDAIKDDKKGRHRCPLGHVAGLHVLSEVSVKRDQFSGDDVNCTANLVGHRKGVVVPAPVMLITPRVRHLLVDNGIKGYGIEIAHFV